MSEIRYEYFISFTWILPENIPNDSQSSIKNEILWIADDSGPNNLLYGVNIHSKTTFPNCYRPFISKVFLSM